MAELAKLPPDQVADRTESVRLGRSRDGSRTTSADVQSHRARQRDRQRRPRPSVWCCPRSREAPAGPQFTSSTKGSRLAHTRDLDRAQPVTLVGPCGVAPAAAADLIPPAVARRDRVVAGTAADVVGAPATAQRVVATAAGDGVAPGAAIDDVDPGAAAERIVAGAARDGRAELPRERRSV